MKIIFSPSKGMNYKNISISFSNDIIHFKKESDLLNNILKNLSSEDLSKIMKIKDKLLTETINNISNYNNLKSHPALFLYDGVSFSNLSLEKYSTENIIYANKYCRILSAFYGVLTPMTLIKPYRLDMTMKIMETSLYNFWKENINNFFQEKELIINLASKEFSKIIDRKKFSVVDIDFFILENNNLKINSNEAKKMRGKMLDYFILNKIEDISKIKNFKDNNYIFSQELSSENKYIFIKSL
ncbi:YaaA family protein [Cetobacterium sp. SF1]|uniref:YaaA family protein n=1 Tax=unclassified Cetobacterium TaxID=2630983 RepID=UPI003CE846C1